MNAPAIAERVEPQGGLISKALFAVGSGILLLVCVSAHFMSMLWNLFFVLMLLLVPIAVIGRSWNAYRKQLELHFVRAPFRAEMRWHLFQMLNRWAFWVAMMMTLPLVVIPIQFKPDEYRSIQNLWIGSAVLLMLLELFPAKRLHLSTNLLFAAGWLFFAFQFLQIYAPPSLAESMVLTAPFRGDWYIFHGGRSALVNHHYPITAQRNALDLCKVAGGRFSEGDPTRLESYAAYGASLFAPAAGKIVKVVGDRPDMPIGTMDRDQIVGNHVILEIGKDRFVLLAHLMKGSVAVAEGVQVQAGQLIARCGNSGNTSQPHLHLQVQNRADVWATDLKTVPILFRDAVRVRGGHSERLPAADLRRNDELLVPDETAPL